MSTTVGNGPIYRRNTTGLKRHILKVRQLNGLPLNAIMMKCERAEREKTQSQSVKSNRRSQQHQRLTARILNM